MKKYFFPNRLQGALLFCVLLFSATVFTSCSEEADNPVVDPVVPPQQTYATMVDALQDMENVVAIRNMGSNEHFKEQYTVYMRQPVDHLHPDNTFFQKLVVRFRGFDRPTVLVTNGYFLQDKVIDGFPIAEYLQANIVSVEHRNFGESVITLDNKWDYETLYQESSDLHAIYMAFKPALHGKWMSTGTSKSGETSVYYGYMYPHDMDLCAAFCSPFLTSLYDDRFGKYMSQESGTPEQRAIADACIRRFLKDGEQGLYREFCERTAKEGIAKLSFSQYVYDAFSIFHKAYSYYYGDERRAEMATVDDSVDELYKKWKALFDDDRDPAMTTYLIDSYKWQGLAAFDYDAYKDLLDGTSFSAREANILNCPEKDRWIYDTYDNSHQQALLNDYLPYTPKPTLLVYSKDDPWTGARPQRINPLSTKLVINPTGIHSDDLLDEKLYKPELTKEIVDFVKQFIY